MYTILTPGNKQLQNIARPSVQQRAFMHLCIRLLQSAHGILTVPIRIWRAREVCDACLYDDQIVNKFVLGDYRRGTKFGRNK